MKNLVHSVLHSVNYTKLFNSNYHVLLLYSYSWQRRMLPLKVIHKRFEYVGEKLYKTELIQTPYCFMFQARTVFAIVSMIQPAESNCYFMVVLI